MGIEFPCIKGGENKRDHNSLNIEGMLQQCSVCDSGKVKIG
jgi:hypothetical protein